jgi:fumarate reductase flavoprotein subunit
LNKSIRGLAKSYWCMDPGISGRKLCFSFPLGFPLDTTFYILVVTVNNVFMYHFHFGKKSGRWQMDSDKMNSRKNMEAQIVVVGGGGAGLAAAVAAAEQGANNIIVLEKRGATGGTSAMASGPFGAESPTQRRQAIIAPRDELFKRAMNWHHLKVNPRIVRAFIDKSGDTIRWLEDKGIRFYCVSHSPKDSPLTWHVSKGNGAEIMRVLNEECQKLGVKILLHTQAKKISAGIDGRINGVLAEGEGNELTITTKKVIIATGGFGGNQEWLKRYCPDYHDNMRLSGLPNMGDGLAIAMEAGAATDGLGMIMVGGPVAGQAGRMKVGSGANEVPVVMTFITGEPSTVWVNKKGRRFIDETVIFNYYEAINSLVRQPEAVCYALLDTGIIKMINENGLTNLASGYQYGEAQRSKLPPGLEKELQAQSDKGAIKISTSWDDIAGWIGVESSILKSTIEEYNNACDHGFDPIFAKDRTYLLPLRTAPFYAIKCGSGLLNTMGGIKVNEKMEVLDKEDNSISGLYAAGVDTGGWTSDTYCAVLPGTALGYALNSGRIAGENAVSSLP